MRRLQSLSSYLRLVWSSAIPRQLACAFLCSGLVLVGCSHTRSRSGSPPIIQAEVVETPQPASIPTAETALEVPQPVKSSAFNPDKLRELDTLIESVISSNMTPGVVLWLEHKGERYVKSYGNRSVEPLLEPMTNETIFDAASLTKVLATGPAIMALVEEGKVDIESPVSSYIPEFTGEGRERITVRHLLTHYSGLRPGISGAGWYGLEAGLRVAHAEKPPDSPETVFRYSDINFILLGELVQRVSGMMLDQFCDTRFYEPLKMNDTGFLPSPDVHERVAPTERVSGQILRGAVHDPTSRKMGGVTGHAGLFTTAADVARFSRMMLNGGELEGVRVLKPETVATMTAVHSPEGLPARGLSWDINSPYAGVRGRVFPIGSYGHTGWTGCSVWIDAASQTFVILMSNRNHPSGGNVIPLRSRVSTLAAEAIGLVRTEPGAP